MNSATNEAGRLDVQRVSALVQHFQLRDVIIASMGGQVVGELAEPLGYNVPEVDVRWLVDGSSLRVVVPYVIQIGRASADAEAENPVAMQVATIEVTLRLDYEIRPGMTLPDDDLHHFVGVSAFMHSWPYLRAEVASLSAKLRIPTLTLPLVVSGQAETIFKVRKLDLEAAASRDSLAPEPVASQRG